MTLVEYLTNPGAKHPTAQRSLKSAPEGEILLETQLENMHRLLHFGIRSLPGHHILGWHYGFSAQAD